MTNGQQQAARFSAGIVSAPETIETAPRFRRRFTLDEGRGGVRRATLRATALGVYEALLDGQPVTEDVLAPGWSSYEWRLRYQTYDVTDRLRGSGAGSTHVLAATVGNGWYLGQLGWQQKTHLYGHTVGLAMELDIEHADGHVQTITTDGQWQAQGSEVLSNDLYDGQAIDGRLQGPSWATPEADGDWLPVDTSDLPTEPVAPVGPPIRRQETLAPVRIWTSPSGATLVDFGQNIVGWVRVTVRGERGREIVLRHAEVLENEELGTRPLRNADATDRFILSGDDDRFEPTLTFHGFRYVEVQGWPGEPRPQDLTAVVVHSDLRRTGHFTCSNEMVNTLHRNVVWGLKGNFLDVPTDCPQRDERLGWTGDIAVFAPTAAYLYDVEGFLADWLRDVDAEQSAADGRVPFVVPDVLKYQQMPDEFPSPESAAIWSDAAVWVPWALWEAYGDPQILRDQYGSMASHVRRVRSLLSPKGLWEQGFQFGDWLDPDASPHRPADAKADPAVVATASLIRSARMLAGFAEVLEQPGDAEEFGALAAEVQQAFSEHYVSDEGTITSDCTTVYTLAIVFDLLSDEQRAFAGARLAELVEQNGYRVSTGFAGTPYITEALSQTGHVDQAYRLLLETECPSWLYPVTMGATTVWERWDSLLPDGTVNPGEMTSFNHYALGSVADWIHRVVGGISPAEPGYSKIRIAPRPPVGQSSDAITWAEASLELPTGTVRSRWERRGDDVVLEVDVPQGTEAELDPPHGDRRTLQPGHHELTLDGA